MWSFSIEWDTGFVFRKNTACAVRVRTPAGNGLPTDRALARARTRSDRRAADRARHHGGCARGGVERSEAPFESATGSNGDLGRRDRLLRKLCPPLPSQERGARLVSSARARGARER